MSEAENKTIFRHFYERAWNHDDLSVVEELLSSDCNNHEVTNPAMPHRELYKQAIIENRAAFPDWALTIDAVIAEGNLVAARWHAEATHTGEAWGIAPTGKRVNMTGITCVRVVNGKITDFWKKDNGYLFWQQLSDASGAR
jgi:predicted ester cyclase